jgi:hypothetical protein
MMNVSPLFTSSSKRRRFILASVAEIFRIDQISADRMVGSALQKKKACEIFSQALGF